METDMIELQLRLMDTLLRSVSRNAQDPEACKLLFGVFLKDMVHTTGGRTGQDWEAQVYFSYVLCRDDEVLAVAVPRLIWEDGEKHPLFSRQLEALRVAGIPLFSDFFTTWKGKDGELTLNLNSQECPEPSGWRFPTVRVPSELSGLLCKKGMVSGDCSPGSPEPVPTGYGNQLGLCETRWYGRNLAGRPRPDAGLYCSAAGWVNRVRLGEHPWGDGPDWALLPLETRLERMRAGRAGNPGHCMSALLRLEAMPVAPLLSECLSKEYVEENRLELQALYGPDVTYGQAARNADRFLRSDLEGARARGGSSLHDLAALYAYGYKLRESRSTYRKAEESEAINEAQTAGRFLSARLARAGISENGSSYLPLAGDCLDDVFEGLSRLTGTNAPLKELYQRVTPQLWEEIGNEWDGSLDGLVYRLRELYLKVSDKMDFDSAREIMRVLWLLLIEPFCLLEEIRSLEAEHSVLLEEIRKQNKALKKELERMDFDGNAG